MFVVGILRKLLLVRSRMHRLPQIEKYQFILAQYVTLKVALGYLCELLGFVFEVNHIFCLLYV